MSKAAVRRATSKAPNRATPMIAAEQRSKDEPGVLETDLQEKIRLRAYELYQQRGGQTGGEVEDWLQAEAEITAAAACGQQEKKAG